MVKNEVARDSKRKAIHYTTKRLMSDDYMYVHANRIIKYLNSIEMNHLSKNLFYVSIFLRHLSHLKFGT